MATGRALMDAPIISDFDAPSKEVPDDLTSSAFYFICRVYDFDPLCKVGSRAALVPTALDPFHLTRATSFDTLPTLV